MTKLRCCFCQQELERNDLDVQLLGCENQNCKHSIHYDTVGSKELWQELIRTRKALEIAVDALKRIADAPIGYCMFAEEALEQITALEQKE